MRPIRLMTIINGSNGSALGLDCEITGLTADSREVRPGFLFAALPSTVPGGAKDGRAFVADALGRGAVAVLAPLGTRQLLGEALPSSVTVIEDATPRQAFAVMAAAFYGRQPETVVAVTGTNGKTSTVQFARQLWTQLGFTAAALGTLGLTAPPTLALSGDFGGATMTTPDPVRLHAALAALAGAGVDHLAMEASSHGLDQFRLDGVRLRAAAFTNLTRDHLDYHGTMEAYQAAKAGLFERVLASDGLAVLNADVPEFQGLAELCGRRGVSVVGYGVAAREIAVRSVEPLPHGQRLTLEILGQPAAVALGLVGRFQAWNALAALGLVLAADPVAAEALRAGQAVPTAVLEPMLAALERLEGVPGRLQPVSGHPNGAAVIVDYAHSPDALETVLQALRPHATGQLVVVFGCGGDRDRGKRPVMGGIAARLADRVIVTDDNPRSEDPAAIRREILAGCPDAEERGDRATAIRTTVRGLAAGDLLVIAGKGHEQGQIVGSEIRPFDDVAEARTAVTEMAG